MDDHTQTIETGGLSHIEMAADIVAAYVSNNSVPVSELPALIAGTYSAITGLTLAATPAAPLVEKPTPAQIKKSITNDALISFEDGKSYKTLKRHLTLRGLTAEAYREKHSLPKDYPMTAAAYSAQRSALAKSLGLGQQRGKSVAPEAQAAPEPSPVAETLKKAGRPRKVKEPVEA